MSLQGGESRPNSPFVQRGAFRTFSNSPGRFFFIGFMGVGKTTCSAQLAADLGFPHVELDVKIQETAGKSVRRIFAEDGEPVYRIIEHRALADAVSHYKTALISCGGGIVCHAPSRDILNSGGYCVLLEASPEIILERLRESLPPLLDVSNPMDRIVQLQRERREYYSQLADCVCDTSDKTVEEVCEIVRDHILNLSSMYAGA